MKIEKMMMLVMVGEERDKDNIVLLFLDLQPLMSFEQYINKDF
jgi:hypothetical protein